LFSQCPDCKNLFCSDCDNFVHDQLFNCPGCINSR
jgi:transcription initiation factor TFIIH subunit 2